MAPAEPCDSLPSIGLDTLPQPLLHALLRLHPPLGPVLRRTCRRLRTAVAACVDRIHLQLPAEVWLQQQEQQRPLPGTEDNCRHAQLQLQPQPLEHQHAPATAENNDPLPLTTPEDLLQVAACQQAALHELCRAVMAFPNASTVTFTTEPAQQDLDAADRISGQQYLQMLGITSPPPPALLPPPRATRDAGPRTASKAFTAALAHVLQEGLPHLSHLRLQQDLAVLPLAPFLTPIRQLASVDLSQ